jgi:Sulfotransferase domain
MPSDRVIIVSIPKSGTYLVAELLKALGYHWTGMHLAETAYTDYSGSQLEEARQDPGRFTRSESLSEALTRIRPGEFAVGHLPFKAAVVQATKRFNRIYLTRDLRSALVSYMRFLHATGRLGAKHLAWYAIPELHERCNLFLQTTAPYLLKRFYEGMAGWPEQSDVLPVRFEDLVAGSEQATHAVNSIASYLGIANYDAHAVLSASLAARTITKSEGLTCLGEYWSPEAERRFAEIGGPALNARLGLSSPADTGGRRWVA